MPGNLLFADTTMPSVTGDTKTDIKRILNHMYMLQEQLRYTLANLSGDNFNDTGLVDLSNIVTADLSITVQSVSDVADGAASAVIAIQGDVSNHSAELTLLAQYSGMDGVVTVATSAAWTALNPKVTATIYYVTESHKYMKYNGTDWIEYTNNPAMTTAEIQLSASDTQSWVTTQLSGYATTGDLDGYVETADLSTSIGSYIDTEAGTAKVVTAASGTYQTITGMSDYTTTTATAAIATEVDETKAQVSLVAQRVQSGSLSLVIGAESPTHTTSLTAAQMLTWAQSNIPTNAQLFYNNTASALNDAHEVIKPSGGFANTAVYLWNGTTWASYATARRTTSIGNPASYSGEYAYVTTEHVYNTVTYLANTLYKSDGTYWSKVMAGNGYPSAASITASVNADGSALKFLADKIDFTGFTTFATTAGLADGTTTVNGGCLSADTVATNALKVRTASNLNWLDFYGGIDMTVIDEKDTSYYPDTRQIIGIKAIRFYEDSSLTSGHGNSSNTLFQTGQISYGASAVQTPLSTSNGGLIVSTTKQYGTLALTSSSRAEVIAPDLVTMWCGASGTGCMIAITPSGIIARKYSNGSQVGSDVVII